MNYGSARNRVVNRGLPPKSPYAAARANSPRIFSPNGAIISKRNSSPRRGGKRNFTCCTENQPLIASFGDLNASVRDFLALNSTNPLFGDFPEKFAQIGPLFESYCLQTTSVLSMYNRNKQMSSLMLSTILAMKEILASVQESFNRIKEKGLEDHIKTINQNFYDINFFLKQIKKETGKSTYRDSRTGGKAFPLQKRLFDLHTDAMSLIDTNGGIEQAQIYSDEIMKFVKIMNDFIDKDLTTIYPYKDTMKMRGMVTSWLATISEVVISSQELPDQIKEISEKFDRFVTLFNHVNEQVGFREEPMPH